MTKSCGVKAALESQSAARIADALGITRQAVVQWERIPAERVIEVERATGVSRRFLRPDLYPVEAVE